MIKIIDRRQKIDDRKVGNLDKNYINKSEALVKSVAQDIISILIDGYEVYIDGTSNSSAYKIIKSESKDVIAIIRHCNVSGGLEVDINDCYDRAGMLIDKELSRKGIKCDSREGKTASYALKCRVY